MKPFAVVSTLVYLAAIVQADDITLCKQKHLKECKKLTVKKDTCVEFQPDLKHKVQSYNTGDLACTMWTKANCKGDSMKAKGKHETIGDNFNKKLVSVKC